MPRPGPILLEKLEGRMANRLFVTRLLHLALAVFLMLALGACEGPPGPQGPPGPAGPSGPTVSTVCTAVSIAYAGSASSYCAGVCASASKVVASVSNPGGTCHVNSDNGPCSPSSTSTSQTAYCCVCRP